ncbi:MAG: replication-associated recombination protein A [Sphingobacteriales bacterium]|jgi:putative ATPase|nr:replication-associated recombination protein A [Sphingobacteriales bacterium]MBP9141986.1 replication-associated recombination protein A [Chitinophagales bacterium]MDA0198958.1 replication-associated recombination protein A [Bacteroidota bacterium]MBK6888919.1 replication-associated recombination protein A [Sphingobacteriales bacterium]MBK7528578.1 replication-associated recombination protein A [Sphingobacteriales bacterium]
MNNQYYPDNLFSATPPLAERMRPKNLDQFIGQQVITGKTSLLRKALDAGVVPSLILWGPPGTGKTTLVYIIANHTKLPLITLNAVESGVRQVREAIDKAAGQGKTLLFIDEIHRFNKAQQDALLSAVEKGIITLIGATTENPSFEVIAPLLSRCSVFVLETLNADELLRIVQFAIHNDEYLRSRNIELVEYEALLKLSGGDARKLLNLLEFLVQSQPPTNEPLRITNQLTDELGKQLLLRYDKSGEQHYDIISAFIKSLRGSDPNAAIYYLVRMIESGEDPKFIARRMLILASEDIGNANPTALVIANTCFDAVAKIGYPECALTLTQTAIYLACSPKSNSVYSALKAAKKLVLDTGNLNVPMHLRNAPTRLMRQLGYGNEYVYPHEKQGNFWPQEYLPEEIAQTKLYQPAANTREEEYRKWLRQRWKEKYDY